MQRHQDSDRHPDLLGVIRVTWPHGPGAPWFWAEVALIPEAHRNEQDDRQQGDKREPGDARLSSRQNDKGDQQRAAGLPTFPPTWKSDWASPYLPPEAIRATREDSG